MKKVFAAFLFVCLSNFLIAQIKGVKLSAFKQNVLPGVSPNSIDENGKTQQKPFHVSANYYIFIECPNEKKITVNHLWIHAKMYDVQVNTPVLPIIDQGNVMPADNKADTLIKGGSGFVLQLTPITTNKSINLRASIRRKIRSNDVVVQTTENGKEYFYYVPAAKIMKPLVLQ